MKYLINGILMLLASLCLVLFFLLGIDMSVANRDYEKLIRSRECEQSVDGCIFDFVCKHFNQKLWEN